MFTNLCLVLLLLLSVGSLVPKFHFQLAKIKKAEKFGKWSDMVHIAADDMTALAQLRVCILIEYVLSTKDSARCIPTLL